MQLLADERVKLDTSLASIIAGHFRTPPKKKTTYFDTLQLKTLIHHSHDIGGTSQAVFFFLSLSVVASGHNQRPAATCTGHVALHQHTSK